MPQMPTPLFFKFRLTRSGRRGGERKDAHATALASIFSQTRSTGIDQIFLNQLTRTETTHRTFLSPWVVPIKVQRKLNLQTPLGESNRHLEHHFPSSGKSWRNFTAPASIIALTIFCDGSVFFLEDPDRALPQCVFGKIASATGPLTAVASPIRVCSITHTPPQGRRSPLLQTFEIAAFSNSAKSDAFSGPILPSLSVETTNRKWGDYVGPQMDRVYSLRFCVRELLG